MENKYCVWFYGNAYVAGHTEFGRGVRTFVLHIQKKHIVVIYKYSMYVEFVKIVEKSKFTRKRKRLNYIIIIIR